MFGFRRIAAAVPAIRVGDPEFNRQAIIDLALAAAGRQAAAVVFPELATTGYTCADLFHQPALLDASDQAVAAIAAATAGTTTAIFLGAPFRFRGRLFNCAFIIQSGLVRGVVPKQFLPNYREFYEKRWFTPGGACFEPEAEFLGNQVGFGNRQVFAMDEALTLGVEICEDLWALTPPSCLQAAAGATVLLNLAASDELVGKAAYRRGLVVQQSARCLAAYAYASAGVGESTTDLVYGGHAMIAENGLTLVENERFQSDPELIFADIDCERLQSIRRCESSFGDAAIPDSPPFQRVRLAPPPAITKIERFFPPRPFVPDSEDERGERCREIFSIQSAALARRAAHTAAAKLVLGVSGGLDSTLALLVCVEALKKLGRPAADILAVSMPGFGTTDQTSGNAGLLAAAYACEFRVIDIKPACLRHFQDIGHDPAAADTTYENVQARERTQILMDLANQERGLVVGTGDLSELALGWSTYSGDHISMYAVNCGVPKTLVRHLVEWAADNSPPELAAVLRAIAATPISPELLPNNPDAELNQRTEDIIGPYELHDFFLYHFVKYGAPPAKIRHLAEIAFAGVHEPNAINKWLKLFISRFFANQFKRSCLPDGPKVGSICLSPRGDWRMPSDATATQWLAQLE